MKPTRLRTRFVRFSALVTSLTVVVFMVSTLIHLRYGMEQAMDQQLNALGPDILTQLNRQGSRLTSDELPVLLTLFDEKNLIRLIEIENAAGQTLYLNAPYAELVAQDTEERSEELEGQGSVDPLQTHWFKGRSWRLGEYSDRYHRILLAADLARLDQSLWQILVAFAFALPLAVAGAALASFILVRQASDPIERLAFQARHFTASKLDARLEIGPAPREVVELGEILNSMMDRLQRSFDQARRFSADASHELKSPLTVMQGTLENSLSGDPAQPLSRDDTVALLDETLRMRAIVEGLLILAKADEGTLLGELRPVSLALLLAELAEDTEIMADAAGCSFIHEVDASLPDLSGDASLLRMAVHNLLSNAVQHGEPGGEVRLRAKRHRRAVIVEVANSGQTIPREDRNRVFERFVRLESHRSRKDSGLGIGLNLAREIALAHGGNLELADTDPNWTCFRLSLPLPPRI